MSWDERDEGDDGMRRRMGMKSMIGVMGRMRMMGVMG